MYRVTGRRHRRLLATAAIVVGVTGGCSAAPPEVTPQQTIAISPNAPTVGTISERWSVSIPPGAAPGGGLLTISPSRYPTAEPDPEAARVLATADFTLSSGQPTLPPEPSWSEPMNLRQHPGVTTMPALVLITASVLLTGCSFGPSTKQQLCAGFDRLDEQLIRGNAGFGNPLFDAADDLADLADRYPGGSMSTDAAALAKIGDDEETDTNELRNASMHIAAQCDRPPVGLGSFLRGPR